MDAPGRSGGATGAPRGSGRARAAVPAFFEIQTNAPRTRRGSRAASSPRRWGGETRGLVLELQFRPDSGIIFEDLVDLVHALSEASQERRRGGGNLGRNPHGDARRLRGLGHPSRPAVVLAPGPAPPLIPGRPRPHLVFKSSAVPAAPGVGGGADARPGPGGMTGGGEGGRGGRGGGAPGASARRAGVRTGRSEHLLVVLLLLLAPFLKFLKMCGASRPKSPRRSMTLDAC